MPVTVKMRKGIDDEHLTYLEAGRAAAEEGATWVALHGRTAAQMYSAVRGLGGHRPARRRAGPLRRPGAGQRRHLDCRRRAGHGGSRPAAPAWSWVAAAWADPGCSGQLAAAFAGATCAPAEPTSGEVRDVLRRHAELLVEMRADERDRLPRHPQAHGLVLEGVPRSRSRSGRRSGRSATLARARRAAGADRPGPVVSERGRRGPRGRTSAQQRVALPEGWLDSCELAPAPDLAAAELGVSGG